MVKDEPIIIVSGLPRSGTSMMMRMLEAGGVQIVADHIRKADEDNPKGYYEFEKAKKIETDSTWLPKMVGKAFKMVSMLLYHLPRDYQYKIIFMERNLNEVLASQNRMLERRGQAQDTPDEEIKELFKKHLAEIKEWLAAQDNMEVLYVSYNRVVKNPLPDCENIADFVERQLDTLAMVNVIDKSLYRQRR